MSFNFDPPAMTGSKDSHWRPANQWRPRSLTPAARAQYLATKMEPDPQSCSRRHIVVDDVVTQLAKHGSRGPDMTKTPNPQRPHNGKTSQTSTPPAIPSPGNQSEHDESGLSSTRYDKTRSQKREGHGKMDPHKTESKAGSQKGSPKLGHAKLGFDEIRSHDKKYHVARKVSNDKIGYEKNAPRTGLDKTGHVGKEHKTGQNEIGQDKSGQDKSGHDTTGHSKSEQTTEGSKHTGGPIKAARALQKETLQPRVLMLGHGSTDRLRVTPRCQSADPTSTSPSSPRRSASPRSARSTRSPYLEDQQINDNSPHQHHHHHHHHHQQRHHQPSRQHHSSQRISSHQQSYHHPVEKERNKPACGSSTINKIVSSTAPPRRHSSSVDHRASFDGGDIYGDEGRIGRCRIGGPPVPFYKAALAFMQAQRQRGAVTRLPLSTSFSASSTPATSPRNSVFYLPSPPLPLPLYHSPSPGQRIFLAQHNPDYPNRGPPKSILRPSPSPIPQRGRVELNSGPSSFQLTSGVQSRSTQPSVNPRPSGSLRVTPRKKVTFGNDAVQLTAALCVDYSLYDRHQWARPPSASGHHAHGSPQDPVKLMEQTFALISQGLHRTQSS
ncbi:hypothetical protein ACOMHN_040296 [Nucella lapillus]